MTNVRNIACADVPIVALVGGDSQAFDDILAAEPMRGVMATDPAGSAVTAYTSGTTSNPKGVIHRLHEVADYPRTATGKAQNTWSGWALRYAKCENMILTNSKGGSYAGERAAVSAVRRGQSPL